MNKKFVLDASALIAFIKKEPGTESLADVLPTSLMSTVNYAEVAAVLASLKMPSDLIQLSLNNLIGKIVPFDQDQALITAMLREATKAKGLSLGDRACLALGIVYKVPILTADKIWADLKLDNVEIKLIR